MANNYYRRRRRNRGKRALRKRNIYTKTGAKAQSKQIAALSSRVKSLQSKFRAVRQYGNWKRAINDSTGNAPFELPSATMTIFPLVIPDKWEGIFNGSSDMENSAQLNVTGFNMEMKFMMSDTEGPNPPMFVDVYLVTVKKEAANSWRESLPQPSASKPYDYQPTGSDGVNEWYSRNPVEAGIAFNANSNIILNKGVFNIHKHRKFTIGNISNWQVLPAEQNYPITNLRDTLRMMNFRMPFRRKIFNPHGKWTDYDLSDLAPEDQIYLIVHYDKPTVAEQGLVLSANCIFTGFTAN